MSDTAKARRFWGKLDNHERFEIGDQLVLGTFDWRDWFTAPPSEAFTRAIDRERLYWEATDA